MNFKDEARYNPWPKTGLVARYKPFILKRAKRFHEYNPQIPWEGIVTDAIRLTWEASQAFKPELGHDFSTYLRHRLWGGLLDHYGIQSRKRRDPPEPLAALDFTGGANGARLTIDIGDRLIGSQIPS
jgi:DNA-directed RNA polymerase specialized sigma subunit